MFNEYTVGRALSITADTTLRWELHSTDPSKPTASVDGLDILKRRKTNSLGYLRLLSAGSTSINYGILTPEKGAIYSISDSYSFSAPVTSMRQVKP